MTEKVPKKAYAAFAYTEFRYFLAFRFLSTLGIQIQNILVAWLLYNITHNPLSLGLIGLAEAVPAITVALFAGYVVDKSERRNVLAYALAGQLCCSFLLLLYTGHVISCGPWIIYFITFLGGLARGFLGPSAFSLLPQLVPKQIYANSSTWNSSSWQIGAVLGPALGGILYGYVGSAYTTLVAFLLLFAAVLCVLQIKAKGKAMLKQGEKMLASLKQGVLFVFKNKVILGALSLDLFAVLFGGAVALLPIFAKDILHVGPQGLGMLRAMPAVGAFSTMLLLAHHPPTKNAGKKLLLCVAAFGLCMILFALSSNFLLSAFLLLISGGFDSVSVIIRSTILQLQTPDEMRGRVSAVNSIFIGSSNEIGAFESGFAAKLLGTITSVLVGGSITILVVIISALKAPQLRNLNMEEIK